MKKFKITETQIDNFNDTNNQFQKFDEGINVICGLNEAGKTTLMDFIKSIFIRKSTSAKGYVKCECDGESFSLNAGDTKKLRENDKYISGITAHDFQTGFVINIDDLMFAKKSNAEELLNTIKDSSGNAVNQKYEEYLKWVYDSKKQDYALTGTNGASASFKKQFEHLKNLDNEINELKSKEDEYNSVCIAYDTADSEFKVIKQKVKCAEIILDKNNEEKRKESIKINSKIIENKSVFDNIRLDFGELKSLKDKEEEFNRKKEDATSELDAKFKELNRLESFDYNDLDSFDLSKNILDFGRNLIEKEKELNKRKSDILGKITDKNKEINELEFHKKSTENILVNMGINDVKSYREDKNLLESYLENYSVTSDKLQSANSLNTQKGKWYNKMFLILFVAMLFAVGGTLILYWNSGVRLPLIALLLVSLAGINTTIMQNIENKRDAFNSKYSDDMKKYANEIIKICQKYNYEIKRDDRFIIKAGAFIKKMGDNISEYDIVEKDLLGYRMSLNKAKTDIGDFESEEAEIDKEFEEFNKEKSEFLEKINIKSLNNLEDIFDYIKTLKDLQKEIKEVEDNLKNIDKKTDIFIQNLNKFIEDTGLENYKTYNKYDYPEFNDVVQSIDKVIQDNIVADERMAEIISKLEDYQKSINEYPQEMVNDLLQIDDEGFGLLELQLREKTEERARLSQQKDDLEKVSGLYALKNEKNKELNNIQNAISKLIQKEIICRVIEKSKEKFNETQPNFISAKNYFSRITNGKYTEIDFENKTISGENTGDKDWDNLSRGTKEQFYLALRLGYANNYSKDIDGNPNGRPDLPVIIDDAFVNFDKERTSAILKCLCEFSKTNQVLYFTCHTDSVKEILKKEKIKYNCIEL